MKSLCFTFTFFAGLALSGPLFAEVPASSAAILQPFVEKHELAGAVALVADNDKVLSVEAVGFADVAAGRPMKTDSMFWIASQSKPITAVAVMMLVDEGKISLDDPVEKYLPEFRGQMVVAEKDNDHVLLRKPAHPFTVRESLNHMSGLPFKSAAEEPTLDGLSLAAAVRTYAMTPLVTEPGTRYQYSNAGINAAARIIEVVTGMTYEDFMQQRLFEPLGMKDTTFWPNEEQAQRIAKSYRPDDPKTNLVEFPIAQLIYPLTDRTRRFPMPAGGLFSTAQDTALFCRMLLNRGELNGRRYLSEAAVAELTKRQTPTSVPESYGLGFAVGPDWFGHGGAHATGMEIRPAHGLVTIWMVQHAGYPGEGAKAHGAFQGWALERFKNRLTWKTAKSSPIPRVESPTIAVNGKLYLFGGFNAELGASSQVDAYHSATDTWTRLKDMPTEVTHLNPAMEGNTIWFAGGFEGKHPGPVTEEVWKYDVAADAWSAGPPLPEGRGAGGLAIAKGELHYFGGYKSDRDTNSDDHWFLPLNGDTAWQRAADMPDPRGHVSTAVLDEKIYALGGQYGHDGKQVDVKSCQIFDPATGKWSEIASLPDGRSHFESSTIVHDGRIIVIGGRCNSSSPPRDVVNDLIEYDPKTNRWRELGNMPQPLLAPSAAIIDGRLIVTCGGLNNPRPLESATRIAELPKP